MSPTWSILLQRNVQQLLLHDPYHDRLHVFALVLQQQQTITTASPFLRRPSSSSLPSWSTLDQETQLVGQSTSHIIVAPLSTSPREPLRDPNCSLCRRASSPVSKVLAASSSQDCLSRSFRLVPKANVLERTGVPFDFEGIQGLRGFCCTKQQQAGSLATTVLGLRYPLLVPLDGQSPIKLLLNLSFPYDRLRGYSTPIRVSFLSNRLLPPPLGG